jgi:hypothetical protein
VKVGDAEVQGPPALSSPLDLTQLAQEVGHPIEGLLGGTYLREFLVTIAYPSKGLTLRRYDTRDHIHDEFDRVGILLSQQADGSFATAYIFPGSDAATNPALPTCFFGTTTAGGSTILSVDGTSLQGMAGEDADLLLRGTPGDHKTLLVQPACGGAQSSFSVRVDDVLPL